MLRQSILTISLLAFGLFSCQSGNDEVRDAARQDIETVTPANPNAAAPAQPSVSTPTGPTTTLAFDESSFDFGTVTEGEIITHTFSFTNTGDEPLIINDARGTCGCTVPSKPTAPIAPGEKGEITVRFDSSNKVGKRNQRVTVTANTTPPQTIISLDGTVEAGSAANTQ
jgi:outer membrane biosynthesis protein TonB